MAISLNAVVLLENVGTPGGLLKRSVICYLGTVVLRCYVVHQGTAALPKVKLLMKLDGHYLESLTFGIVPFFGEIFARTPSVPSVPK